jgi:hypothetical protein
MMRSGATDAEPARPNVSTLPRFFHPDASLRPVERFWAVVGMGVSFSQGTPVPLT